MYNIYESMIITTYNKKKLNTPHVKSAINVVPIEDTIETLLQNSQIKINANSIQNLL